MLRNDVATSGAVITDRMDVFSLLLGSNFISILASL
jgi:hypothetical protein